MIKKIIYTSFDNKDYETFEECLAYEWNYFKNKITFYDIDGEEINPIELIDCYFTNIQFIYVKEEERSLINFLNGLWNYWRENIDDCTRLAPIIFRKGLYYWSTEEECFIKIPISNISI